MENVLSQYFEFFKNAYWYLYHIPQSIYVFIGQQMNGMAIDKDIEYVYIYIYMKYVYIYVWLELLDRIALNRYRIGGKGGYILYSGYTIWYIVYIYYILDKGVKYDWHVKHGEVDGITLALGM